jgi:predicted short-subunit dehydrogenase-like oxidoreductase (DUF2520 family)
VVQAAGPVRSGAALTTAPGIGAGLPQPFAIVGAGRMGRAMAAALRAAGVPVTGPHGRGYSGAGDAVVLLCVPDDEIGSAASRIGPGPVIGHCSGASGLDVLGDRPGFSVHPLMTVTPAGVDFRGVFAAVDGSSSRVLAVGEALAEAAGLRPVRVAGRDRVAYHAAASIAANYLVTLEAAAAELLATAGLEREVLVPLARAALENWGRLGPAALTGPVARGDVGTVARHRAAMADRIPELVGLLDALVTATQRLAGRSTGADQGPSPPAPAAAQGTDAQ